MKHRNRLNSVTALFGALVLAACGMVRSTQVPAPESQKASTDSVVEYLITVAATDFQTQARASRPYWITCTERKSKPQIFADKRGSDLRYLRNLRLYLIRTASPHIHRQRDRLFPVIFLGDGQSVDNAFELLADARRKC